MSRTFKARNTNGVASVEDGLPHTALVNTNQDLVLAMAMATAGMPTDEIPMEDSSQNTRETRPTAQRKEGRMAMEGQEPT